MNHRGPSRGGLGPHASNSHSLVGLSPETQLLFCVASFDGVPPRLLTALRKSTVRRRRIELASVERSSAAALLLGTCLQPVSCVFIQLVTFQPQEGLNR